MTIPRAKRSDSLVGCGSGALNLLGSRSSGLIHRRLPPEINDTREAVEVVVLVPIQGSILDIVETPKSATHARKFLIYMFALIGNAAKGQQGRSADEGRWHTPFRFPWITRSPCMYDSPSTMPTS